MRKHHGPAAGRAMRPAPLDRASARYLPRALPRRSVLPGHDPRWYLAPARGSKATSAPGRGEGLARGLRTTEALTAAHVVFIVEDAATRRGT